MATGQPLQVFVSIPPQKYLVERIGKEFVDVNVMLEAGDSPETFDPRLRQISKLYRAQLYFRIGVAFEKKWLSSIEQNNSEIKIVNCCDDILTGYSIGSDKHVWTSAKNAQSIAALIKQELTTIDPGHALQFEHNYQDLILELKQLDSDISKLLGSRRTNYFFTSHAALGYFARDYGLLQLSLEKQGSEPGARTLVGLVRKARQEKIQFLLVQKQHHTAVARAFANEIGAKVVEFDPLREDYLSNLRSIAGSIAAATQ